MDKNGLFLGAMLDSASRAYAAGIATRVLEALPDLEQEAGFATLTEEAEHCVRVLAETVAVARPRLFAHEMAWCRTLSGARGQTPGKVEQLVEALEAELVDRLPGNVTGLVSPHVAAARHELEADSTPHASPAPDDTPLASVRAEYVAAILEARSDDAVRAIVEAADGGHSVADLHDDVIIPAQQELGHLWLSAKINIGDEHLGTRTTEQALAVLRMRIAAPSETAPRVLAVGAPGSRHDLGLRVAIDRLQMSGWRPIVLGADVPVDDAAETARAHGVVLAAVAVPMTLNLRAAHAAVSALKQGGDLPVIVGGGPLKVVPELWQDLGADGGAAHASEVVEAARRACPSAPGA